jgi:hypothetical protein
MSILATAAPLRLTKETLEQRLATMTVDQGRAAYLAYGNVPDTVQTLRLLARTSGVSEDALAHAIWAVRQGAAEIRRVPDSRVLSRGTGGERFWGLFI